MTEEPIHGKDVVITIGDEQITATPEELRRRFERFRDPASAESVGLTNTAKRLMSGEFALRAPGEAHPGGNRAQRRAAKRKRKGK